MKNRISLLFLFGILMLLFSTSNGFPDSHHIRNISKFVPEELGRRDRDNMFFHGNGILGCTTGVCLQPSACQGLGGSQKGLCPGQGVCCNFKNSCNHVTRELVSTFHSPEYPKPTIGTLVCQYEVMIQSGVCGVRLDFQEFNTTRPLDRGICNVDQFLVLNSLEGTAFPRCGELTGYSTFIYMEPTNRLPLILLSIIQSAEETFKWDIKVTQMRCSQTKFIKDDPACTKDFSNVVSDPIANATDVSSNEIIDNRTEKVAETFGGTEVDRSRGVDNAFYIEYLKQAYQAMTDGPSADPNRTTCKNSPLDKLLNNKPKTQVYPEDRERIIRGNDALPYEFPWQVSIQDKKGHVCGGAIISEYSILSASHCFMSVSPIPLRNIKIVVGDLNLNITNEVEHEVREIHSVLFHSHFDPYYLKNDIAVIRLKKPLKFRRGIQPVCLAEAGNSYVGQNVSISGWGATNYPLGKLATHLQTITNSIVENSECKSILKIEYIYKSMMCAVSTRCGGTCFGDSGGPLVHTKKNETRLIGIVSFGIGGCALFPFWPDVYTRVSEYLTWLSFAVTWD